jgi:hypothetical protein
MLKKYGNDRETLSVVLLDAILKQLEGGKK